MNYLYGNHTTKGSLFRLLARSGADGQSLCLRRRQVDEGLVTDVEYIRMRDLIHPGVRAFTIVPMNAIEKALRHFGHTMRSSHLAEALNVDPWDDGEEVEGQEAAVEAGGVASGSRGIKFLSRELSCPFPVSEGVRFRKALLPPTLGVRGAAGEPWVRPAVRREPEPRREPEGRVCRPR